MMSPSCSVLMNLNFWHYLLIVGEVDFYWLSLQSAYCLVKYPDLNSLLQSLDWRNMRARLWEQPLTQEKKQWVCRAKNQIMVLALCGLGVMWHMSWCQMQPMKSYIGRNGPMRIRKSSNSCGSSRQPYNCFPSIITRNINWGSRVIL